MSACIHRWRIASPNGERMLPARCKKCGAQKAFPASSDYAFQGQSPLTLKGSVPHVRPAQPPKSPATHCVKGHELTPDNLTVEVTGRVRCLTCRRMYSAKSDARRKRVVA